MRKKTVAITLSIFVAIMPFLGFPEDFKIAFYVVSGLLLSILIEVISIQSYDKKISSEDKEEAKDVQVEN